MCGFTIITASNRDDKNHRNDTALMLHVSSMERKELFTHKLVRAFSPPPQCPVLLHQFYVT